jgi:hypothetical protein
VWSIWQERAIGASHPGGVSERKTTSLFLEKIDNLEPKLATYYGSLFDLRTVRYRYILGCSRNHIRFLGRSMAMYL